MSVNAFTVTTQHASTFQHPNSGFSNTVTQAPMQNSYSQSFSSGNAFFKQYVLTSGGTQLVDFVSGGLLDPVSDNVNSVRAYSVQFMGLSGGIQMENYQSGGLRFPSLSTQSGHPQSGFGFLITPQDVLQASFGASGNWQSLGAGNGNLNFRAVSGNAMFQVSFMGQ
jgi:hypothetical protein